jgi:hypothetical protein
MGGCASDAGCGACYQGDSAVQAEEIVWHLTIVFNARAFTRV